MHVKTPAAMMTFLLNSDQVILALKDLAHNNANGKLTEEKAYQI